LYFLDKACFLCLRVERHRRLVQDILELSDLQRLPVMSYYTQMDQEEVTHSLASIVEDLGQHRYCGIAPSLPDLDASCTWSRHQRATKERLGHVQYRKMSQLPTPGGSRLPKVS
jgi:hypothetical protein